MPPVRIGAVSYLNSRPLVRGLERSLQEKMIAFQRKSLKVERDVAPENVYDLSIVRSVNEEMGKNK